jgi:hypothetical protein
MLWRLIEQSDNLNAFQTVPQGKQFGHKRMDAQLLKKPESS